MIFFVRIWTEIVLCILYKIRGNLVFNVRKPMRILLLLYCDANNSVFYFSLYNIFILIFFLPKRWLILTFFCSCWMEQSEAFWIITVPVVISLIASFGKLQSYKCRKLLQVIRFPHFYSGVFPGHLKMVFNI